MHVLQVPIAEPNGIKVATIFENPVVNEADLQIYASHTKHFPVRGTGFHSAEEKSKVPKILLDGIPSSHYRIQVHSIDRAVRGILRRFSTFRRLCSIRAMDIHVLYGFSGGNSRGNLTLNTTFPLTRISCTILTSSISTLRRRTGTMMYSTWSL